MTSPTTASRARNRRCAHCNRATETWLCGACAFSGDIYRARFYVDSRPTSPSQVGRRNLYPGPTEFRGVPVLPALKGQARFDERRRFLKSLTSDELAGAMMRDDETHIATAGIRFIDAEALNRVAPIDPRRWCDECICGRVHRHGCPMIEMDGKYVGGYPDDGTHKKSPARFGALKDPGAHWLPRHHRQHARAIRRRWTAFRNMWERICLDYLTRWLTSNAA